MPDYSRTRTSEATLLAGIKALLSAYTSWNVATYAYNKGIDVLSDFIHGLQPPCVVVTHIGSKTTDGFPGSVIHEFSAVVSYRDFGSLQNAIDGAHALVEKVYELLDFQLLSNNTVLLSVKGYDPFDYKDNAGTVSFEIKIIAEDN